MSDVKHTEERTETHACDNERTETHGDLISRKAAINRIRKQMDRPDTFGWWTRNDKIAEVCYKIAIEILERLPSAQPELIKQGAYVRGFEQGRTQGMIDAQDLQPTCNKLATDCISRQAAIDTIVKQSVVDKTVAKRVLAQLPSAEPERAQFGPDCHLVWQYCRDPNDVMKAVMEKDENWEGLYSPEQIISIVYDSNHKSYVVFWIAKW